MPICAHFNKAKTEEIVFLMYYISLLKHDYYYY